MLFTKLDHSFVQLFRLYIAEVVYCKCHVYLLHIRLEGYKFACELLTGYSVPLSSTPCR